MATQTVRLLTAPGRAYNCSDSVLYRIGIWVAEAAVTRFG